MADHLSGMVGQAWQVVRLTCGDCERLASHNYEFPFSLAIDANLFAALDVVLEVVNTLPDPALLWEQAVANVETGPEYVVASVDAPVAPSGSRDVPEVRAPIHDLSYEIAGATDHRFTPDGLVQSLLFPRHLRPNSSMSDALADADSLLHGPPGIPLQEGFEEW